MKNFLKVSGLAGCVVILCVSAGWGEESPQGGMFDRLKDKILATSEQTLRLSQENQALKKELVGLQLEVDKYRRDIERLDPDAFAGESKGDRGEQGGRLGNGLTDQDMIREAQEIYLSGEGLAMDDAQRLRELKMYELQYQKQILDLDLKLLGLLAKEAPVQAVSPQTLTLRQEVQRIESEYETLLSDLAEAQKAAAAFPQEIEMLRRENQALKKKIQKFQW